MSDTTPARLITLGYLKTLARILLVSGTVGIAAILARLFGRESLDSSLFKAPVRDVWVFFVAATIAHLFWTRFAVQEMEAINRGPRSTEEGSALLDAARSEGGLFLRGLLPRSERVGPGDRLVAMDSRDPTAWLSYGLGVVAFVAIAPWHVDASGVALDGPVMRVLTTVLIAVVVLVVNWRLGSLWIVTLSQMALPRDQRWAFTQRAWFSSMEIAWRLRLSFHRSVLIVATIVLAPLAIIYAF